MTKSSEKAYEIDEGLRWRDTLNRDLARERIIKRKEQVEWSKSDNYARQLKYIPQVKKPFSIINMLKYLIP